MLELSAGSESPVPPGAGAQTSASSMSEDLDVPGSSVQAQRMAEERDEFSEATKDLLARRAGFRCSMPTCQASTSGPGDPRKASNVGVAAHIRGAAKKGPRYDPNQTSEERRAFENGIWMCSIHGKLIDDAKDTHTVETLEAWKAEAERRAGDALGRPLALPSEFDAALLRLADRTVERLREVVNGVNDRRADTLDAFDSEVRRALARHRAILESGASTPEALLGEPEFQKIVDNYVIEATREALLERARMLAYALAGSLCNETLTISQKSRVERVIRELDPSDVFLLHEVNTVHVEQAEHDDFPRTDMKRYELLAEQPASRDILHASGCVTWENNGGLDGGVLLARVTTIGLAVLEILSGFIAASEAGE